MTSDLERSKKYLRSILLATKGGVPEAQLVKRYREQTGENIPFRRFNCSSLQAFLQSVPDVCRVTVRGGAVVVEGVATAETKHIKEMVKMQGLHPAARTRGNGSGGGGGGGRGKCFSPNLRRHSPPIITWPSPAKASGSLLARDPLPPKLPCNLPEERVEVQPPRREHTATMSI